MNLIILKYCLGIFIICKYKIRNKDLETCSLCHRQKLAKLIVASALFLITQSIHQINKKNVK